MTAILTLISGVLWFVSIQPRSYENEFLYLEQMKYGEYILFTELDGIANTRINNNLLNENKDICFANTLDYTANVQNERRIKIRIQDIQSQSKTSVEQARIRSSSLYGPSGMENLNRSVYAYSIDIENYYSRLYTYARLLIAVFQNIAGLCMASPNEYNKRIEQVTGSFFLLNSSELLTVEDKEYLQGLIQLLVEYGTDQNPDTLKMIREVLTKVQSRSFDPRITKEDFLSDSRERVIKDLKNFEIWQKSTQSQKRLLVNINTILN